VAIREVHSVFHAAAEAASRDRLGFGEVSGRRDVGHLGDKVGEIGGLLDGRHFVRGQAAKRNAEVITDCTRSAFLTLRLLRVCPLLSVVWRFMLGGEEAVSSYDGMTSRGSTCRRPFIRVFLPAESCSAVTSVPAG